MRWTPTRYTSGNWSIEKTSLGWFAYRSSFDKTMGIDVDTNATMLGPFDTMEIAFDAVEGRDQ